MYLKMAPESYLKNYVVQGPGTMNPSPCDRADYFDMREFGPGQVVTMSHPLICGLFTSTSKWLPLHWLNPLIEIELCDPTTAVRLPGYSDGLSGNTTTYSGDYSIENCRKNCDLCTF